MGVVWVLHISRQSGSWHVSFVHLWKKAQAVSSIEGRTRGREGLKKEGDDSSGLLVPSLPVLTGYEVRTYREGIET